MPIHFAAAHPTLHHTITLSTTPAGLVQASPRALVKLSAVSRGLNRERS